MKKILSKKNLRNIIFIVIMLVILLVPSAKAFLLRGLMEIGLFEPKMSKIESPTADLSGLKFKEENGQILSLGDLKGKVIFLNFWATWCPPCLAEMPSIHKLHQQFKEDKEVVFILVDADGDFTKTNAFLKRKAYNFKPFTFYSDLPKNIFDGALPTTVVFDKQGRLSFYEVGAANYATEKFITFIKNLKELKH